MMRKLYNACWYLVGGLILMTAVAVTLIRLWLPGIDQYRKEFEQLASNYSGYPVSIETITASWQGWSPWLYLRGVTLHAPDGSRQLASFDNARVRLDLLASLWQKQPVLESLIVSGAQLKLIRSDSGGMRFSDQRFEQTDADVQGQLSHWLMQQPLISLRDVSLVWIDEQNRQPPLQLTEAEVNLRTWHGRVQIDGHADLPSRYGGQVRFALDINGDPTASQWSGKVYLEAHDIKPAAWPQYSQWHDIQLRAGIADLRLWSHWQAARLMRASGLLELEDVLVRGHDHSKLIRELGANFHYRRGNENHPNGWQASAQVNRLLTWNGAWPVTEIYVSANSNNTQTVIDSFYISQLRLEDVYGLSELRNRLKKTLGNDPGKLRGHIQQLYFQRLHDTQWQLSGRLENGGLVANQDQWQFDGLAADFAFNEQSGRLRFHTNELSLADAGLIAAPVSGISITGTLDWFVQDDVTLLQTESLQIDTHPQHLSLSGKLRWNANDKPYVNVLASLSGGDLQPLKRFIPTATKDKLETWLRQSLQQGKLDRADMVLRGDLDNFPFKNNQGQFRIEADFSDVHLQYHPEWPPANQIKAQVIIDQDQLKARIPEAVMYSARLYEIDATIANLFKEDNVLKITGRASGTTADATNFVQNSPLQKRNTFQRLLELELAGKLELKLDIAITLFPEGEDHFNGEIHLLDNRITSPKLNLTLEQVTGYILFEDEQIRSRDLQARYYQTPVTLDIRSATDSPGIKLSMQGQTDAALIRQLLADKLQDTRFDPVLISDRLHGSSPWRMDIMAVGGSDAAETLHISSSLEGMAIDLPPPLGKTAATRRPLRLTFPLVQNTASTPPFRLYYDSTLSAHYNGQGLAIHFGQGEPPQVIADTITIDGRTPLLDIDAWIEFFNDEALFNHLAASFAESVDLDIEAQALTLYGQRFDHIHMASNHYAGQWKMRFTGQQLDGTIILPADLQTGTVIADLNRLYLQTVEEPGVDETPRHLDPLKFPALSIEVRDFVYGENSLGQFNLTASRAGQGLRVDEVRFNKPGLDIHGQGQWLQTASDLVSQFDLNLNADRISTMLATFGYAGDAIDGGKTALDISAQWSGSPMNFSLAGMKGTLELLIEDGQFLQIDPGAGRLFGLLSIQALPRRLSLDFTDLFNKGFTFDRIKGHFTIENGTANTNDLTMEGPAALITVTGRTDLVEQTYDQIVTVIPHFSNSLPVASALFGPIGIGIGAVLFLTGQVFESIPNQIDRLLSYQYTVTGSWENPIIEPVDPKPHTEMVPSTETPLSPPAPL